MGLRVRVLGISFLVTTLGIVACESDTRVPDGPNPEGGPKALGERCAQGSECESGFCPADDGICCNKACDSTCEACVASKTGFDDGQCALVDPAIEPDPDDECAAEPEATCGSNGAGCSGVTTACALWEAGTVCALATCMDGAFVDEAVCDGGGSCEMVSGTPCAPYRCNADGNACLTLCDDDLDCDDTTYCVGNECVPKKAVGASCGGANECESGSCADGVCCDTGCDGLCEACVEVLTGSTDGTCAALGPTSAGGPDPEDECLGGETCDGAGACSCVDLSADEMNDTEATATSRPAITDCDNQASFVEGWLPAQSSDADWYVVPASDTLCLANAIASIAGDPADVTVCVYPECQLGATTITCSQGTTDTSPDGRSGCCNTGGPVNAIPACQGAQENINMFIRVTSADANACIGYRLDYHY